MLTTEQRKARAGKITSSIAAGALGLNPRMTPIQAWLAARGEAPDIDTKATQRGNRLEGLILDSVAEELGLIRKSAEFRSKAPWAGDSTDALYFDGDELVAIGEGKSASLGISKEYGEEGTDEVPESTLIQSHWHLWHWPEVRICWVPVLVGGYAFEFRRYRVDHDEELEGILVQDLERWHRDYVVTGKMPPAAGGDSEYLTKLHPHESGEWIPDAAEVMAAARDYHLAHNAAKAAIAEKEDAKARLQELLGSASGCKAAWGKVTWTNNKPTVRTDWEAVATELGATQELVDRFTIEKPGPRVMRVTYKGE